jgi:hypothetical protein
MHSTEPRVSPTGTHEPRLPIDDGGSAARRHPDSLSDDSSEGTQDSSGPPSPLLRHARLSPETYKAAVVASSSSSSSTLTPAIDPAVFSQVVSISQPKTMGKEEVKEDEVEWTEEERLAKELEREEPLLQENPDR